MGTDFIHRNIHGVEPSDRADHSVSMAFKKSNPKLDFNEVTENKQFSFTKIQKKFGEDPNFSDSLVISDYHKMGLGKFLNKELVDKWNAAKIAEFGEEGAKARNYIVTLPKDRN